MADANTPTLEQDLDLIETVIRAKIAADVDNFDPENEPLLDALMRVGRAVIMGIAKLSDAPVEVAPMRRGVATSGFMQAEPGPEHQVVHGTRVFDAPAIERVVQNFQALHGFEPVREMLQDISGDKRVRAGDLLARHDLWLAALSWMDDYRTPVEGMAEEPQVRPATEEELKPTMRPAEPRDLRHSGMAKSTAPWPRK